MTWKNFLKPTVSKIILLLFFGFVDYRLGVIYRSGTIIHHQIFGTDAGFVYFAFSFLFIYSYLLSCVIIGFSFAIKNRESTKVPTIALVILSIMVCGAMLAPIYLQENKSNNFLINQGFIPSLDTREKCLSKGFLWLDLSDRCYNNFTKEECQSRGYLWNKCFNINKDFMTEDSPTCIGKCIIK